MDYKFLDKVLDQIVSETEMDYEKERAYTPFFSFISTSFFSLSSYRSPFTKHCKEVYGLNIQEIQYVWNNYREIFYKLRNNG